MAKKKQEEAPKGAPAWMATFSDLMNLLLCFFVLLFSMSTVDAKKFEQIAASFSKTFSIFTSGDIAIGEGNLIGNGISQLNDLDDYINNTGYMSIEDPNEDNKEQEEEQLESAMEEEGMKQSEDLAEKIEEAMEELNLKNDVSMDVTAQYVQLTMRGSLLFNSGSADLKEESYNVLDRIGVVLERYSTGTIEIEGHTDNVPIHTAKFPGNDELSSARALSVFHYLISTTALDPMNVKHAGRGEYVPVADNNTPEGRAMNRRVEIRIYNQLSSSFDGSASTQSDEAVPSPEEAQDGETIQSETVASEETLQTETTGQETEDNSQIQESVANPGE